MNRMGEIDGKGKFAFHKKEEISDTCYDIDELWGCYAKWNKPVTKTNTMKCGLPSTCGILWCHLIKGIKGASDSKLG